MHKLRQTPRVSVFAGLTLWLDDSLVGRALEAGVAWSMGRGDTPVDQEQPIAVYCAVQIESETWFWEKLRSLDDPQMNPVIIIGQREPTTFFKDSPAFLTWPSHQAYLKARTGLVTDLLHRIQDMEAIDDESVARQIATSGKLGRESRLIYRLHSWKFGDVVSATEDLALLRTYFNEQRDGGGIELCRRAQEILDGKRWSLITGADFGLKFSELLRRRASAGGRDNAY